MPGPRIGAARMRAAAARYDGNRPSSSDPRSDRASWKRIRSRGCSPPDPSLVPISPGGGVPTMSTPIPIASARIPASTRRRAPWRWAATVARVPCRVRTPARKTSPMTSTAVPMDVRVREMTTAMISRKSHAVSDIRRLRSTASATYAMAGSRKRAVAELHPQGPAVVEQLLLLEPAREHRQQRGHDDDAGEQRHPDEQAASQTGPRRRAVQREDRRRSRTSTSERRGRCPASGDRPATRRRPRGPRGPSGWPGARGSDPVVGDAGRGPARRPACRSR